MAFLDDLADRFKNDALPAVGRQMLKTSFFPGSTSLASPVVQQTIKETGTQLMNVAKQGVPALARLALPSPTQNLIGLNSRIRRNDIRGQLTDVGKAVKLGATVYGLPRLTARNLAASALVSGGFNRLGGGSFTEGMGKGIASAPTFAGIGSFTNPAISGIVNRITPKVANPASRFFINRGATGALSVPEGMVMHQAVTPRPYNATSLNPLDNDLALDFLSGFATGSTQTGRRLRQGPLLAASQASLPRSLQKDAYRQAHDNQTAIVDVLKRYDTQFGDMAPAQGVNKADISLYDDAITLHKKLYGARAKPPATIENVVSDIRDAFRAARSQARKGVYDVPFASSLVGDVPPPKPGKYAGNINLERMNVSKTAKQKLSREVNAAKAELESVRGRPLSQAEVVEAAKEAAILKKVVSRDQTKQFTAELVKLRQAVAKGSQGKGVTQEFLQSLEALSSQAADWGRRGNAFRIGADPVLDSTKTKMVQRLLKLGYDSEEILRAARNVDFDDNRQAVAFYRSFVKPKLGEMLEEFRYLNLLSSPRTHIVNVFSNSLQTGLVRPATKLVQGVIDPAAASLTGGKREASLSEVPAYYRGMFRAMPDAWQQLKDVFSGKQGFTNLDLDRIPTNTALSKANVVTKSLEGMDQFFQTLIRAAESESLKTRGGLSEAQITKQANDAAEYAIFRRGLNTEGQGHLLDWFDKGTAAVMQLRKVPGMGWFVPFIQTPMNILKQGIEYSPAGFGTAIGSANQREQVAKALLGSTVFMGAGILAMQDRLTWAAPKDQTAREAFYAAGYQPYSVKMGDKWVSFNKIGPLAYPLAMAAAIKHAYEDDPNAAVNGFDEKALASLSGIVGFLADQSYMQGIGDMIKAVEGREGFNLSKIAGNVAGQYVPLASLQRWVTNVIDPIYRKGDGVVSNIAKGIPGLSDDQPYYENPLGDPSRRQYPVLNAINPLNLTKENPEYAQLYDMRQQELRQNAILNREEKELEQELAQLAKANQAEAAGEILTTDDKLAGKREEMNEKLAKKRIEVRGGVEEANGKIFYQDEEGTTKTINLGQFDTEETGIGKFVQQKDKLAVARQVYESPLPDDRKGEIYQRLGVDGEAVEYDAMASQDNAVKAQYVYEQLQGADPQTVFTTLAQGRTESVSGTRFIADGVIDYLEDIGMLDDATAKALKKIKPDKQGNLTGSGGRGSRGPTAKQRQQLIATLASRLKENTQAPTLTLPRAPKIAPRSLGKTPTLAPRRNTSNAAALADRQTIDQLIRRYAGS